MVKDRIEAAVPIGELKGPAGVFCVWMTAEQGDVVRRALDEWRYTIAASHADNDAALVVMGQVDERLGR